MKKRILCCFAILALCLAMALPAFAAEAPITEPEATVTPTEEDGNRFWHEMLDYLEENGVSADSFGSDTVDKLILLGERFAHMKEEGYTLEERLRQLITPENLLTTASAIVLVLSTVLLFIMKSRQRAATLRTARSMEALKEAYDREAEENEALGAELTALREEQEAIHVLLMELCQSTSLGHKDMKKTRDCALGVANMVKDVFLNARTLDHAGKDLMIRNYLAATGEPASDTSEDKT